MVLFPKSTGGTDSLIQIQCEDKAGHSTYTNNVKEIDVTQVTCNTNAIRKKNNVVCNSSIIEYRYALQYSMWYIKTDKNKNHIKNFSPRGNTGIPMADSC